MDYLFEVTENYVWHEFSTAYCYSRKIRAYIDRRHTLNRWFNWIIMVVSVTASISYWSNTKVGAILSGVAAVFLALKELLPFFTQPESELMELHKAATFYAEYQTEMEQLYISLKYLHTHPAFCIDDFFKLKKKAAKFLAITNEYYRGLPKKIEIKINNELDDYVDGIYPKSAKTEL